MEDDYLDFIFNEWLKLFQKSALFIVETHKSETTTTKQANNIYIGTGGKKKGGGGCGHCSPTPFVSSYTQGCDL